MGIRGSSTCALSICAAAALLAACGGSQPSIFAPPEQHAVMPGTARDTVLYSFAGGSDGAYPEAAPILINDELYGTTATSGNGVCNSHQGCGTVYKLSASGHEQVLHLFRGGKDGEGPASGVIDVGGNLYGVTRFGGGSGCKSGRIRGCGTIYEVTRSGKEKVLYAFPGGTQGADPDSLMFFKGAFYGEAGGGGSENCYAGCGLIFKMSAQGHVTTVYAFKGRRDGAAPSGGLLLYKGDLYGTTGSGGGNACAFSGGCGTAFKMTASGSKTTLHAFGRTLYDGASPDGGLVMLDGAFFGTTFSGGKYDCLPYGSFLGCGTAFTLTPSGRYKVIYSFDYPRDSGWPNAVIAVNGNLYGTTGGAIDCGAAFELTPSGQETTLYYFKGGSDGCAPASGLTNAGGTFYGTTSVGGAHGLGIVYSITR
jgi:uncharacterized repeat protein (TIGR03803 family)